MTEGLARPGLGTCILVATARAGTEVSLETTWLQGGRIVRGVIQGDSRRESSFLASLIFSWRAGCRATGSSRVTIFGDINRAAADAISGATIKPVQLLPQ